MLDRDRRISPPRRSGLDRRVGDRRNSDISVIEESRSGLDRRQAGERRSGLGRRRTELSSHPATVLFVGRHAADGRLLQELFEASPKNRFALEMIEQPKEARTRLTHGDVDAVLLDASLTDAMQGLETLASVEPAAPILLLSPTEDEELGLSALKAGAQDFLVKDRLDRQVLVHAIRYAIERHRLKNRLRDLSLMDELTGLYNRRGFVTLATEDLRLARRNKQNLLVAFGDLDDLKQINDTLGHAEGDTAIKDVSGILRRTFRDSDLIARIGGDEFAVLVRGADTDHVEVIRRRLKDELAMFSRRAKRRYRLKISLGFAQRAATNLVSVESLLRAADRALYQEKRRHERESGEHDAITNSKSLEKPPYEARAIDILLVEDNAEDAALTRRALDQARLQNRLSIVADGFEALAFLKGATPFETAAQPDVVLLDLDLPRMDGHEVLSEMRQDPLLKDIPVVVLTATKSGNPDFNGSEPDAFLTKPVNFHRLADAIKSVAGFGFTIVKLSA
ncbi:MAG TPA: diguanylate cyclase [Gemmatimonadales bacterium]|nr:diguanylate cyclase [Gemmatimonadales bacterium]